MGVHTQPKGSQVGYRKTQMSISHLKNTRGTRGCPYPTPVGLKGVPGAPKGAHNQPNGSWGCSRSTHGCLYPTQAVQEHLWVPIPTAGGPRCTQGCLYHTPGVLQVPTPTAGGPMGAHTQPRESKGWPYPPLKVPGGSQKHPWVLIPNRGDIRTLFGRS